jgi:sialate O-acetylesterase
MMTEMLWLPAYFQSGMVLQQQVPFIVRGRSRPSVSIKVMLERRPHDGRAVSPLDSQYGILFDRAVKSGADGRFQIEVPASEATFDPHELTVTAGEEKISLRDVLFGEVWIAAGQSNMQMPLRAVQTQAETNDLANLYYVRILSQSASGLGKNRPYYTSDPADDLCEAEWQRGDHPQAMSGVSAAGFSFVRKLHLDLKIPVALIETALGGSCIHSWISRASIDADDMLRRHLVETGFYRDETDWDKSEDWETTQYQPAALYNSKIAPLHFVAARGVLWYQGESDYQYPEYYKAALQTLVKDWHRVFRPVNRKGLAFLIVQLAPYYYGHKSFTRLAEFNEMLASVRHALTCPAALLPVYDLPPDYIEASEDWRHPIHPTTKLPIGQRLEQMALGLLYQRKAPQSAPECTNIEIVGNKMLLSFDQIGEGLRLSGSGDRLRGFAICGSDRVFVEAQARILYGVRVMVWHDQIRDPQAVTYAYADMNLEANLISRDHLPVVPFRSDRFASRHFPPAEWTHCESLQVWCCPDQADVNMTGWLPRWRIERGQGELAVEPANKTEGDGSFFLRYRTDAQMEVGLEPLLHYASLFPPLDLSDYAAISLSLFNTDQHMKAVRLAVAAGTDSETLRVLPERFVVLPTLRWQQFTFQIKTLPERNKTHRLVLVFEDKKKKGDLYIDKINLVRHSGDL